LKPGQTQSVSIRLEAMVGEIELLALGPKAKLEVSVGQVKGARITDIPLGSEVQITVKRQNFRPWTQRITISSEDLVRIEVPPAVAIRNGTLFVNSRPFSKVYLNGRSRGRTPVALKLSPGSYRLLLKRPDGKTHSRKVRVGAGRKQSVVYRWP